jgi:hypothetical protein
MAVVPFDGVRLQETAGLVLEALPGVVLFLVRDAGANLIGLESLTEKTPWSACLF